MKYKRVAVDEEGISSSFQPAGKRRNKKMFKILLYPSLVLFGMLVGIVFMKVHEAMLTNNATSSFSTDNGKNACSIERSISLDTKRNVYYDASQVSQRTRFASLDQKGVTVWFTGLSGSGKSTIGKAVEDELIMRRKAVFRLDGDNVRIGLNRDLGFSQEDRKESVRRVSEMAALMAASGTITLVGLVSPYRMPRDEARELHTKMGLSFIEVFVDAPLSVVTARDTKGLYAKAMRHEIDSFTGISAPYEAPLHAELVFNTSSMSLSDEVSTLITYLEQRGFLTGVDKIPEGFPGIATPDDGNAHIDYSPVSEKEGDMTLHVGKVETAWPRVLLRHEDVHWVSILGEGWAAPLQGFMKEGAYLQSLHFSSILYDGNDLSKGAVNISSSTNFSDYTTPVGIVDRVSMSVPIVLPINDATKSLLSGHSTVVLVSPSGVELAVMSGIEIFPHRKEERIARTFGATDSGHPYIAEILKSGNFLLGGDIALLNRIVYNDGLDNYRKTPAELRTTFEEMGADAVLAFQTRNPTHAGHAYLMKSALEELKARGYKNPILWLSPLGGWTKKDDVPLDVRIRQHEAILRDGMLDINTTVLSIWPSPMIYAGPREVQWHAKSRKNAGASFFVVGRDPAGIKESTTSEDLYAAEHGRYVLRQAPGLDAMQFISFGKVYYDRNDHAMKPMEPSRKKDFLSISGSRMRKMAKEGLTACVGTLSPDWEKKPTCVPPGFMVTSGWDIVVDYYQNKDKKEWIPYPRIMVDPTITNQAYSNGTFGKTTFQLFFQEDNKIISPWHDIPLQAISSKGINSYSFVVEIPKGTMAKMEVNKNVKHNPIMQDLSSSGDLRYYAYGVPFFNYGMFPQTWEDPSVKDSSGNGGDNDPLDVMEVGTSTLVMGSVHPVKILGCLELIDGGEVDHKIIALSIEDEHADVIHSISDLEKFRPGIMSQLVDWLKNYKTSEGKGVNVLTQDTSTSREQAEAIVQDTHERWLNLTKNVHDRSTNEQSFWLGN